MIESFRVFKHLKINIELWNSAFLKISALLGIPYSGTTHLDDLPDRHLVK